MLFPHILSIPVSLALLLHSSRFLSCLLSHYFFTCRCVVLHDVAEGLLLKSNVLRKAPPPCLASTEWAQVRKKLEASFPEIPDVSKVKGFDALVSSAQDILDQTAPMYQHFLELSEYLAQAHLAINALPALVADFKLDRSQSTMCSLLRLVADYLKIHLLMAQNEDKKSLLVLHLFAYQCVKRSTESNVLAVTNTLKRFDKAMLTVSEELQGVSDCVGDVLLELRESMTTALNPDLLRQRNALNPLEEGMNMVLPTAAALNPRFEGSVPLHDELTHADMYVEWGMFAVFACPMVLIRPEVHALFTQLATGLLVVPLFEDLVLDVHKEAETLAAKYPPSKAFNVVVPKALKLKKDFKDLAVLATTRCGEMRRERRSYLCGEITNLVALFRDVPGLLAPKFPMAVSALAMAQAEIRYYFAHLSVDVPKARAKLYKVEDYYDENIALLIGAATDLTSLVKLHSSTVEAYYGEYLAGAHCQAITALNEQAAGLARDGIQEIFTSLPKLLAQVPSDENKNACATLRLNWGRAHAVLLSKESSAVLKAPAIMSLVHRMRTVCMHSKFTDSIEELVTKHMDLTCMWFYKSNMAAVFGSCLTASDESSKHSMAFFEALATVADNVHPSCPEEQLSRGLAAANLAQDFMGELSKRVENLLRALIVQLNGLNGQIAPVEAAYKYERQLATPGSHENMPGYESMAENAQYLKPMVNLQANASNLLGAIAAGSEEIVVYDRVFRAKELVKLKVQSFLRETYRRECKAEGVPPPSALLRVFNMAVEALQVTLGFFDFDISTMLRKVLFDEATSCIEKPYSPGLAVGPVSTVMDPAAQCVVQHYAAFYKKLCEEAVPGGKYGGVVMSPLVKGFIGNGMDRYTDVSEMRSLYTLVGGYGMAILESELVRLVGARASNIKTFLQSNATVLQNFKTRYTDGDSWDMTTSSITRDLRGLDEFLADSAVIGNVLSLRRLIAEAVRDAQALSVPFAGGSVSTAKVALRPSAFEANLSLAYLAQESCGLMDEACGVEVDQSVKVAVTALGATPNDVSNIWSYLPYAYAVSFVADTWKSTAYDARSDVMKNNLHMCAVGMAQLFQCFAFKSDPALEYIRAASFLLLRMKSSPTFNSYPVRAQCIFLDKFVSETGIVGRGMLQNCLPFSLLHSSLVDVTSLGLK